MISSAVRGEIIRSRSDEDVEEEIKISVLDRSLLVDMYG
jgi:membrane-bound ClpP family serine protease